MLSGGMAEGWYAYAINSASPAPVPWTAEKLHFYLRNGWHEQHGISRGTMAPVTTNLAAVSDEDVRAIAVYVASIVGEPSAEARRRGETAMATAANDIGGQPPTQTGDIQTSPNDSTSAPGSGQAIFEATCASCHDGRRPLPYGGINLHLSTAVNAPDPTNIINVVLHGLPPMSGEASPIMPGYRSVMTDEHLTSLLAYLRSTFSDRPAWTDLEIRVREAREAKVAISPNDGATAAPGDPSARTQSW